MRLSKETRAVFSKLGKKGGKARFEKLSQARRSEIAKMGAEARKRKAVTP